MKPQPTATNQFTKGPWRLNLIVELVARYNSHAALIEAARAARHALEGLRGQCDEKEWLEWADCPEALNKLRTALEKAKL